METSKRASVFFLMHNTLQSVIATTYLGRLFRFTGHGGTHWAVLVKFEDDDFFYICEIYRNLEPKESGLINWRCEKITAEEIQRATKGNSIEYLGNCYLTLKELRKHCRDISANMKYNILTNNCQHWCKNLIQKLNFFSKPASVFSFMTNAIMVGIRMFSR
ncbi:PREDICTED: uncharacterized protein LOC108559599 [Nicrophorus vespilloides]|uniref:Uncharacterized protein LOC108559599 n=1 Tax=Nicrophorus vespilloides TaxID=110193 RepID=A0ABM1MCW9_NICVS|nr:PREDICTED: uncharacterized protein LOC108559599 [Nicrophorus vespilloides]